MNWDKCTTGDYAGCFNKHGDKKTKIKSYIIYESRPLHVKKIFSEKD